MSKGAVTLTIVLRNLWQKSSHCNINLRNLEFRMRVKKFLAQIKKFTGISYLTVFKASPLHSMLPERQNTVLQTHLKNDKYIIIIIINQSTQ